jgi:hypothetical protein
MNNFHTGLTTKRNEEILPYDQNFLRDMLGSGRPEKVRHQMRQDPSKTSIL